MGHHAARTDAATTAALLGRLLEDTAQCGLEIWPEEQVALMGGTCGSTPKSGWPMRDRADSRLLARGDAHTKAQADRRSYIERLLQNLRPCGGFLAADENVSLYLRLLDRALEDRRINDIEQAELLAMAEAWGLGVEDVHRAHDIYLRMLAKTALEDGIVTANEQADLGLVCDLLGVNRGRLKQFLGEESSVSEAGIDATTSVCFPDRASLAGLSVCFTGVTLGPLGEPISREEAERLAAEAGLVVARSVTKKLDLLVVADPDTQSGKAKKARDYGTRRQELLVG